MTIAAAARVVARREPAPANPVGMDCDPRGQDHGELRQSPDRGNGQRGEEDPGQDQRPVQTSTRGDEAKGHGSYRQREVDPEQRSPIGGMEDVPQLDDSAAHLLAADQAERIEVRADQVRVDQTGRDAEEQHETAVPPGGQRLGMRPAEPGVERLAGPVEPEQRESEDESRVDVRPEQEQRDHEQTPETSARRGFQAQEDQQCAEEEGGQHVRAHERTQRDQGGRQQRPDSRTQEPVAGSVPHQARERAQRHGQAREERLEEDQEFDTAQPV